MFEAYKIGVRLTLVNHVSHGLNAIIGHLRQTHGDADVLQKKLKEIKLLGIAGAAIGATGFMGLGMIGKTLPHATEYAHQLALMNQSGMKHLEIVNATKAAWAAMDVVPTSNVMENLAAIRELRMVFGDTGHATQYMPILQQVQGILQTVRHGEGSARSESYELAKALEIRGAVKTPEQFVTQADAITKAIIASGGKVGATDFLTAFKYGRAATAGWNDEFTYKILPTFIQELKTRGGSGASGGAGPALMSAYAAVVGGSITQRALATWNKLGLIDPSKIVMTKDGHLKGVNPGGILHADMFQANPYQWVNQILRPAMLKVGAATETQQRELAQYLFPNRTAGFGITQFLTQAWKFERDKVLIDQAKGLGGYKELLKNDPTMARLALTKQWESLLASIGYNIMPQVIKVTLGVMGVVRSVVKLTRDHTGATKALVWAFGGLSAALAISGTVLTLKAAFSAVGLVLGAAGGASGLIPLLMGPGGLVIAIGAAGFAIYKLVSWLWDKGKKQKSGDYHGWDFGSAAAGPVDLVERTGHKYWDFDGNSYTGRGIPGRGGQQPQVIQLNIDGKQVTKVVVDNMSRSASGPQKGTSKFDPMMLQLAPSIREAW